MKFLLLILASVLLICKGIEATEISSFDGTAVAVHNIHKRDIFDALRTTLNGLVTNLNTAASNFNSAVTQFLNASTVQTQAVLSSIQNTTNEWLDNVETAISTVLNSTTNILTTVTDCLVAQQDNAVDLVNGTINGLITCVGDVVDGVQTVLVDGSTLALSATTLAVALASNIVNCGVANLLNFAQVGICLNGLVQTYTSQVNVLVGSLVSFTTSLLYNVVSIPTTFSSCLGSTVAIAVFQVINILQEIPACITAGSG